MFTCSTLFACWSLRTKGAKFCNSFLWKPCSYLLWAKFCNSFGRKPCSYLLAQTKLELSPPPFLQQQGMPFTHFLCFNLHFGPHIIVPLLIGFPLLFISISCIDKWAYMGKYSFFRAWYIAALVSNNPGDFFADLLESKLKHSPIWEWIQVLWQFKGNMWILLM